MTKERPIIFSGEMVRAILDGRKTQTRRVWKQPTQLVKKGDCLYGSSFDAKTGFNPIAFDEIICPYGRAGRRLWVRETFAKTEDNGFFYRADGFSEGDMTAYQIYKWTPSIYMPRTASRIDLLIKSVRVERLNDISDDDAVAEGSYLGKCSCFPKPKTPIEAMMAQTWCHVHGQEFKNLWKSINGSESWDMNPLVWVIEFERIS